MFSMNGDGGGKTVDDFRTYGVGDFVGVGGEQKESRRLNVCTDVLMS